MPPRTRSTTGQQSARKNKLGAIQRIGKLTPSQRKTRSQAVRSANTLAAIPTSPFLASPPLTDLPQTRGQKRKCASQDVRPGKRLHINPQFAPGSGHPLSEENLATLDRDTGSHLSDKMDHTAATPENGRRKRSASRQSSTTDMTRETTSARSQKSSSSTCAQYRWVSLDKAQIFVRSRPLPEHIKAYIDAVTKRKTSEERKHKLAVIAKTLSDEFVTVLEGASREDDSVEPIHHALSSMDSNEKFAFPRKIDWDHSLKPEIPQFHWYINVPAKPTHNADDVVDLPSKRRQADTSINTPDSSEPAMPPPPPGPLPPPSPPPVQNNFIVKTPRPDITVGLRHSTVVETLVAQGVDGDKADRFLKFLQEQRKLCSDPTQQAIQMRFPLLVVEGKSYSTGRVVFEAENQAAVSGSCMMNIQYQLAELTESVVPGFCNKKEPLAFSICTQGPCMELWVHYTTSVGGMRKYNMNILKICHASLQDGVMDFLMAVDNILGWAGSEFVKGVAKQLATVERATRQPTI